MKGIFYEPDCLDAADDLVKRWSFDDCSELYADVTRGGMRARMKGIAVLDLVRELGAIADEGLRRQAVTDREGRDERLYLEPLRELLAAGRSAAQVTAERWAGPWKEQVGPLVAASGFPATPQKPP